MPWTETEIQTDTASNEHILYVNKINDLNRTVSKTCRNYVYGLNRNMRLPKSKI